MNYVRLTFAQLQKRAGERPPGYAADVMSRGSMTDDEAVYIAVPEWMELMAKYQPAGLGTLVYRAAHPIAVVADHLLGTQLRNCGGCAERMEALNG